MLSNSLNASARQKKKIEFISDTNEPTIDTSKLPKLKN